MIESLYRFRSTKALLDEFHELENQEIYFASPKDLNDPLEGFTNLFWKGDGILWSNLLSHYLICLMHAVFDAILSSPDHPFIKDRSFVFSAPDSLPTPQFRGLYQGILELFFQHQDIEHLPAILATRRSPTKRNELMAYFGALHLHALNAVLTAMEEHELMPPRPADDPLRTASKRRIQCKDMVGWLNASELEHPELPDIAEKLSAEAEFAAAELDLMDAYNGNRAKREPALQTIICEFPKRHIIQIEQLLYADWYTACFVQDPMQASMWGNYGDSHKGVCLKFRIHPSKASIPMIRLKRITGQSWHSGEDASTPTYGYAEHEFCEVAYEQRFADIDFFRSLGMPTVATLDHWYKDTTGNVSPLVEDIFSDPDSWRDQYWANLTKAITTKLADWTHENEYRLTLVSNSVIDFGDGSRRKVHYDFQDLQGLIFGIRTSTEDKIEIMRIIAEKCKEVGRDDFEFYQAYYSHSTGKMEMARMNLLRLT